MDGAPFFWLGDTAWELFHRASREEAERYLRNRAERRFTVIQAVALAELDGLHVPNAYGESAPHDTMTRRSRTRPTSPTWTGSLPGPMQLGLYVGFLPTWGDKWNKKWGVGPEIFTPANAAAYGEWLGARYRHAGLIWILGGDRPIESDAHREIVVAMARGLRKGDGGAHLMTFHPTGGSGSSQYFHEADWLDVNMRQNGHAAEYTGRYDQTRADYDRSPPKPVLDGEPIYEDHPVSFDAKKYGHSISADVRRPVVLGPVRRRDGPHLRPSLGLADVGGRPGPDQQPAAAVDRGDRPARSGPDAARARARSSRARSSRGCPTTPSWLPGPCPPACLAQGAIASPEHATGAGATPWCTPPVGRPFAVRMNAVTGPRVIAWWFNPRDGRATRIGTFANTGERTFTPPDPGEMLDWVLVLDDAGRNYPPPGTRSPVKAR